jgi:hypothetical protein
MTSRSRWIADAVFIVNWGQSGTLGGQKLSPGQKETF